MLSCVQPGDRVVTIDGTPTAGVTLNEVRGLFADAETLEFERTVERKGEEMPKPGVEEPPVQCALPGDDRVAAAIGAGERDVTIVRRFTSDTLGLVVSGDNKATVSKVVPASVADVAGILEQDRILRIDGATVGSTREVTETLRMAGTTVVISVIQQSLLQAPPRSPPPRHAGDAGEMEFDGDSIRFTPMSPEKKVVRRGSQSGHSDSDSDNEGESDSRNILGGKSGLKLLAQKLSDAGAYTADDQARVLLRAGRLETGVTGPPKLDVSITKTLSQTSGSLMSRMRNNPRGIHPRHAAVGRLRPRVSATPPKDASPLVERATEIFSSTSSFRRALFQLDKLETSETPMLSTPLDLFKPTKQISWTELLGDEPPPDVRAAGYPARQYHQASRGGPPTFDFDFSVPAPPRPGSKKDRTYRCMIERDDGSFGVSLVSSKLFPYPRVITLADRYKVTKSGLREGDRVLEVNGQSVFGKPTLATELLKACDSATLLLERDSTPIKGQEGAVSYRVKAATSDLRGKSKIPVLTPDLGTLFAQTNHAQRVLMLRGGRDRLGEQLQLEYANLKKHIAQANWYYNRLADDMTRLEDAESMLEERERQLDAREAEIEKFVSGCNDLVLEKETELETKRASFERELQYRTLELDRKRKEHEAALEQRAEELRAALEGKLRVLETVMPPRRHTDGGAAMAAAARARAMTAAAGPDSTDVEAGDRVRVEGFGNGTVKYVGVIEGRTRVGVELDFKKGFNDGAAKGTRYFWCAPGYGVFVVPAHIRSLGTKEDPTGRGWSVSPDEMRRRSSQDSSSSRQDSSSSRRKRRSTARAQTTKLPTPKRPNGFDDLVLQASAAAAAITAAKSQRQGQSSHKAAAGPRRSRDSEIGHERYEREESATPMEDPDMYDSEESVFDEDEDDDSDGTNFDGEWTDGEFGSFSATRVITSSDDLPSSTRSPRRNSEITEL